MRTDPRVLIFIEQGIDLNQGDDHAHSMECDSFAARV